MGGGLLHVEGLHATVEETEILRGVDLTINAGEVHAIMGLNGAGKSTLASVIMGHPAYEISAGSIHYDGQDLSELEVHERARSGLFLSFQYPHPIPGVQVGTFLRKSVAAVRGERASRYMRHAQTLINVSMRVWGLWRARGCMQG